MKQNEARCAMAVDPRAAEQGQSVVRRGEGFLLFMLIPQLLYRVQTRRGLSK
jgi:hypothetical protein